MLAAAFNFTGAKTEGRDKYPAPRYNGEIIETRKNLCEQF